MRQKWLRHGTRHSISRKDRTDSKSLSILPPSHFFDKTKEQVNIIPEARQVEYKSEINTAHHH